jgi:hypothetical protein
MHGRLARDAVRRWVLHDVDVVAAADAVAWIDHRPRVFDAMDVSTIADALLRLCPPAHI